MVQFQNITKVFNNGLVAVEDISFIIEEGEFVFLIGPSGSGKTTLIELLIRDQKPSSGKLYFDDSDITHISRQKVYKLRRQIGVIFQDFKLVEDKTAYENVAFAMEAAGKSKKEIKETVPYVLDVVGLTNRVNSFPKQLSGGEQQRVAIARAISNNPKLLIADEPTGNLDPGSAWDIVQILTKINNWGTTVLMSTHGTDIVNTLNKRVIQMQEGKLIRDDSKGQYEFENDVDSEEIKDKVKETKKKSKKKGKIKVDLSDKVSKKKKESKSTDDDEGDTLDQTESEMVDDTSNIGQSKEDMSGSGSDNQGQKTENQPVGFFGRLFGRSNPSEVVTDQNENMEERVLAAVEEEVKAEDKDEENQKENETSESQNEDESFANSNEDKDQNSKESKTSNKELKSDGKSKSQESKTKLNTSLKSKSKNKKSKSSSKNKKKHKESDSVEFLTLPKKFITRLKNNGFKKISDLTEMSPSELIEESEFDKEEVSFIAEAIEEYVDSK